MASRRNSGRTPEAKNFDVACSYGPTEGSKQNSIIICFDAVMNTHASPSRRNHEAHLKTRPLTICGQIIKH